MVGQLGKIVNGIGKKFFMTPKKCARYQIGFPFLRTINDSDYGLSKRRQECHHIVSHK
jgi:hypothetical protein